MTKGSSWVDRVSQGEDKPLIINRSEVPEDLASPEFGNRLSDLALRYFSFQDDSINDFCKSCGALAVLKREDDGNIYAPEIIIYSSVINPFLELPTMIDLLISVSGKSSHSKSKEDKDFLTTALNIINGFIKGVIEPKLTPEPTESMAR